MAQEPLHPDVVLDVYFDGRLVQSIRLGPALFSQTVSQEDPAVDAGDRDRTRRNANIDLPPSGRCHVNLHLHAWQQARPGSARRQTFVYNGTGSMSPFDVPTAYYFDPVAFPPSHAENSPDGPDVDH